MVLHVTRRRVLAGSLGSVVLAGCVGPDSGGEGDDGAGGNGTDGGMGGDDEPSTGGAAGTTGDYELHEANVVEVEVSEAEDGAYEFAVTLHHDDRGEDGYADRWQVETRDGEELGRRELTHGHGVEPFTRSGTVEVPDDVECVVVRGHDQTHGFGGQAMLVSLPDGVTEERRQGDDPDNFSDVDCP